MTIAVDRAVSPSLSKVAAVPSAVYLLSEQTARDGYQRVIVVYTTRHQ
jgi:hypothetical protein